MKNAFEMGEQGQSNRKAEHSAQEKQEETLNSVAEEMGTDELEELLAELSTKNFEDLDPEQQQKVASIREKLGGKTH